jgi:hypothetical protein
MIKLLFILLVGHHPLASKNNNNLPQKPKLSFLIGNWNGKYDTLNAVLTFNRNYTGGIKWSASAKTYHFKYRFKYDSIIVMWDKSRSSMHTIVLKRQ